VLNTLLRALDAVGDFCVDAERRRAIAEAAAMVGEAAEHAIVQAGDRHPITDQARAVTARLSA
jgi:uncharacterized membrane protein